MRRMRIWMLALAFLPMLACEQEEIVTDLAFEEGEMIGRDFTRWMCGGGWYIASGDDTVTVQNIDNQEIMSLLEQHEQSQLTVEPNIKVWVVFDHAPTSSCATNFPDAVKEIRAIHLRED